MRVLSPVEFVPVNQKELSQSPASARKTVRSAELNGNNAGTDGLISSTPLITRKRSVGVFFDDARVGALSPIDQSVKAAKTASVPSLAPLEADLQIQYNIATSSVTSKASKETPQLQKSMSNCSVRLKSMDIDRLVLDQYSQSIPKMTVAEKTNLNQMSIVETPIARRFNGLTPVCDSILASKLRQCEMSSDNNQLLSLDEDQTNSSETPSLPLEKSTKISALAQRVNSPEKSLNVGGSVVGQASAQSEASDNDIFLVPSRPPLKRGGRSRKKSEYTVDQSRRPSKPLSEKNSDFEGPSSNSELAELNETNLSNTSISKVVPEHIIQSINSLRNRSSAIDDENPADSMRIVAPSRKRKSSSLNPNAQSYLQLSKRSKRHSKENRDTNHRRRTLFSQDEDEEETVMEHSQQTHDEPAPKSQEQNNAMHEISAIYNSEESTGDIAQDETSALDKQQRKSKSKIIKKRKSKNRKLKSKTGATKKTIKQKAKTRETSDEGSNSDGVHNKSSRNEIKYDPCKRGCKRTGLRIRRLARPWWLEHCGNYDDVRIEFNTLQNKDFQAETKFKKIIRQEGLNEHLLSDLEKHFNVKKRLNLLQKHKKEVTLKTSVRSKAISRIKSQASKNQTNSKARKSSARSAYSDVDSYLTLVQSLANPNSHRTLEPVQCQGFGKL